MIFFLFSWIYSHHTKDQAFPAFIIFKTLAENQFKTRIQCLQSDNGGEFRAFHSYLVAYGIEHKYSCPKTPEQNGRAETSLTLLAHASLPLKFLHYAFHTTVFLINRMPTRILHLQSPFQVLFGKILNYHPFKVFGCLCYPYIRLYNKHKLSCRLVQCLFLGYSASHKGYFALMIFPAECILLGMSFFMNQCFPFNPQLSLPTPYLILPSFTPPFLFD